MNSLSVANPESLAAVKVHHALPSWIYNNAQLSRLEFERVLKPSWQIVCHVNSIPKTGDFQTLDLGSDSVMVLRDRDGSIRAFHNVCRHRGARLLDGAGSKYPQRLVGPDARRWQATQQGKPQAEPSGIHDGPRAGAARVSLAQPWRG